MKRTILAIFSALVAWVLVVSLLNLGLRQGLAGYAAAEPTFAFTLGMQLARLAIAAVSSVAAGVVAAWIAPQNPRAPWIAGVILVVVFLPTHVKLWHSFPLWYHLMFLLSLVALVVLGARFWGARGSAPTTPTATR
jgi:hypothetical protein